MSDIPECLLDCVQVHVRFDGDAFLPLVFRFVPLCMCVFSNMTAFRTEPNRIEQTSIWRQIEARACIFEKNLNICMGREIMHWHVMYCREHVNAFIRLFLVIDKITNYKSEF